MASLGQPFRHPIRYLFIAVFIVGTFRFVTGRPMSGHRKTNATFIHEGTKAVGEGSQMVKVGRWDYYPGWKRAGIRVAAAVVLVSGAITYAFHRAVFVRSAWVVGALVLVLVGILGWQKWRRWQHDRAYVRPLHIALKHMLGLPDTTDAADYITVPKTFATNESTPARVILPETFNASAENQRMVGGLLLQKLGAAEADMDVTFRTVGHPSMLAKKAPKPPKAVLLADVLDVIDACEPGEILLGKDKRHHPVKVKFPTESPHWGFSCESGTGKSALLGCIAAQVIRQHPGNRVVAIDPKIISLEALRGVPGVRIVNNPITDEGVQEMWGAVGDVADEVMRRAGVLGEDPTAEFPMWLLIIDEVNMLAALSTPVWERVKPKGDKGKPPVWTHLLKVLAAGRQFRIHVVIVGQDLRESALGGIGLRSMLGLRAIAGYDTQMWHRFMQTRPVPAKQSGAGRWCYRINGADTWVQNLWAGPDPLALADFAQSRLSHVPLGDIAAGGSGVTPGSGTTITGIEAASAWLEMTPSAFRKARQRHPIGGETRRSNRPCWSEDDLRTWRETTLEKQP